MGSRYYRDPPRESPRWDRERFEREDRYRGPPVLERERERYERGPTFEDRFFAEERYGPPARRQERRYYEEDDFYERRAPAADAVVPYRPRREEAPPRPGLIRRQSSLDTFDRRPLRRYNDHDESYRAPLIPVPIPPRRPSPPRYRPRMSERDFEDIRVAEPDFYGDDEYRTYREREWTNHRSRRRSNSSEIRERVEEEIIEEAPWPRRGKTKMPRSKVHTRAIIELGYPYEEEGETIILLKALNKSQIDEVIARSQEFREREAVTTTTTIHVIEPGPVKEEIIEKVEKVTHVPMSEAPRSVREWDTLRVERDASPTRTHRSRRSRSTRHRSRSRRHSSSPEAIIEERKVIREISPTTTHRTRATSRSRRTSSPGATIISERRIVEIESPDESNLVHAGPLTLVSPRRRTDRELREEIRELEEERRVLRFERGVRDREVIIERGHPVQEIIEVRKDKKAPPPDPRIIRAMMKTLT